MIMSICRQLFANQMFRFLFVGGSSTALQFIFLIAFVELLSCQKLTASTISYILSAAYNYILNYYLTFNGQAGHGVALPKFVIVVVLGLFVNALFFTIGLKFLPYVIAQLVAVGAALITNYILHKYWIYRE